jgi:predicted nucleic acid-binding protein
VILVDTSIWVELLNGNLAGILTDEMLQQMVTCPPVVQEVLQGTRAEAVRAFSASFEGLPRLVNEVSEATFVHAAEIYRLGRQSGYTIRSPFDCLIAAIAIEADVPLWHRDQDFEMISRYTALRLFQPFGTAGAASS